MSPVDYAQRIAARVRELRAEQGVSRRALSQSSNVSERYLASAESGRANLSISVLQQIAQALNAELIDLVSPQRGSQLSRFIESLDSAQQEAALAMLQQRFGERRNLRGIALIGLRGAGKTTLGKQLAKARNESLVQICAIRGHDETGSGGFFSRSEDVVGHR